MNISSRSSPSFITSNLLNASAEHHSTSSAVIWCSLYLQQSLHFCALSKSLIEKWQSTSLHSDSLSVFVRFAGRVKKRMIESVSVWNSSGSSGLGSNWFGRFFSPSTVWSLSWPVFVLLRWCHLKCLRHRLLLQVPWSQALFNWAHLASPKSKVQGVPFTRLSLLTSDRKNSRCSSYAGDVIQFCCGCKFSQITLLPQNHW